MFLEWIYPMKLDDFKNKTVLDCGCGRGNHLNIISKYCKQAIGIDLNSHKIAEKLNKKNRNVKVIQGDISTISLKQKFDIVYCIGVIQHTDDPDKTFNNIKKFVKGGGRLAVWVYSKEGNFITMEALEPMKKYFFSKLSRKNLLKIAKLITAANYIPVYTIYKLPLKFLPFYEYFQNWKNVGWNHNLLNVFDKLNGPTTHFISKDSIRKWFNEKNFKNVHVSHYVGVSWRASGIKK